MFSIDNLKIIFAAITVVLTLYAYYKNFQDVFEGKSKPHFYTFLIWTITQITATLSAFYGGGGLGGTIPLLVSTVLTTSMAITCIWYGTKKITKQDTYFLILALSILPIWWLTKNAYLAVFMATVIDGIGYLPTFRKTWQEPKTETPIFWFGISAISLLNALANAEYNFLTMFYLIAMTILNAIVFFICIFRKKK